MNCYFLPNCKNFRVKLQNRHHWIYCINHILCVFKLLLLRMRELCPMKSCLVINKNEKENSYKVEKLSSTSPLSSATTVNQNNKQQRKLYSSYPSLLLTASLQLRELESCMPTSLLLKFWLQYCCSYTEKLYTSKSYHLAYYGYLKCIIHDKNWRK